MDHTAVVTGLVAGKGRFFFQNGDAQTGPFYDQLHGCRHSDDSTSNDRYIK
jgi:hypothetical protein